MPKRTFNITLKGYVGGWDFSRSEVDRVLKQNAGSPVYVLIDSLGGSLATGLSISAAFGNHGNVNVHFVGLNASAATIASMGAKHISIDRGAMYLVHKCSTDFFEWSSMNADQFQTLIDDCSKVKEDLDKLDQNVAKLYAARCKKKKEDMLELMKRGGWLTPDEALAWGFVDEITDYSDDEPARITDAVACILSDEGLPFPDIRHSDSQKNMISKLISSLSQLLKPQSYNNDFNMKDKFKSIAAVCDGFKPEVTDCEAKLTVGQLEKIESAINDKDERIKELNDELSAKEKEINELKAALDAKPAESTHKVVESSKGDDVDDQLSDAEQFVKSFNAAQQLFNEI